MDRLIDLKRELKVFVGKIENSSHRLFFKFYYLGGSNWEEVATLWGMMCSESMGYIEKR